MMDYLKSNRSIQGIHDPLASTKAMSCKSGEARRFLLQYGEQPDAANEYGETLLHVLAGAKWNPALFADYSQFITSGWSLEKEDAFGNTPVDQAIDCGNWAALGVFIRSRLSHSCMAHAIGELLAQYQHIGTAIHDQFILALMQESGILDKEDCRRLFVRACNGAAWPYLLPLWVAAAPRQWDPARDFPWQIADNAALLRQIQDRMENLAGRFKDNEDVFRISNQGLGLKDGIMDDKRQGSLIPFISSHRRCITRRMKASVRKERIRLKDISTLLVMFRPKAYAP